LYRFSDNIPVANCSAYTTSGRTVPDFMTVKITRNKLPKIVNIFQTDASISVGFCQAPAEQWQSPHSATNCASDDTYVIIDTRTAELVNI